MVRAASLRCLEHVCAWLRCTGTMADGAPMRAGPCVCAGKQPSPRRKKGRGKQALLGQAGEKAQAAQAGPRRAGQQPQEPPRPGDVAVQAQHEAPPMEHRPEIVKGSPAKQASVASEEASPKGKRPKVSKAKARKNNAWGAKRMWIEMRDNHVQNRLPVTKQTKSAFLEYMSTQWDVLVQRNDPRPWEMAARRSIGKAGRKTGGDPPANVVKRRRSGKRDSVDAGSALEHSGA